MEYEYLEEETSRPTVMKIRSGMFSAEDGLFLACFLAVTIVVAGGIRLICRRYCGAKCTRCAHKQDPADGDQQIPSIIIDTHKPGDAARVCLQQQTPQPHNSSTLLGVTSDGETSATASVHLCCPTRDPGNIRRGSHLSNLSAPTMQTVYEEEESDDPQDEPLRSQVLGSPSGGESDIVYTVYHFPQNQSPELMRTITTTTTLERSPSISLDKDIPSSAGSTCDLPPSYDDLFPVTKELKSSSKTERKSGGLSPF